ncbi:hypothetical protein DPMN_160581, partial [Dreissena polymorpha]
MTKQMYTTDFGIKTKYRYLLRGENECATLNYKNLTKQNIKIVKQLQLWSCGLEPTDNQHWHEVQTIGTINLPVSGQRCRQ